MDKRKFQRIINKSHYKIYKKYFYKSKDINDSIRQSLKKDLTKLLKIILKFHKVLVCLIKAEKENLFNEDISQYINSCNKINYYLEEILIEFDNISNKVNLNKIN